MTTVSTCNANLATNFQNGGSVWVTLASNVGQGNGGTSLPCAGCWISCESGSTAPCKVNIGAAASAILGVTFDEATTRANPMWIPIDDVSKLYFYSAGATDTIDIMYVL